MSDYKGYLEEKIHQIRIIASAQWDYLSYSDLCNWLDDNFNNDEEGKYFALKILLNTIYYSKKDLEKLLEFGLNEKVYGEIIKSNLIEDENIYIPTCEAEARINNLRNKTLFVPLLDSDKPSESGNSIIRDLVHKINIPQENVTFHWDLCDDLLKKFEILIFVDDCIGSGNQLRKFWNSEKIKEVRSICIKNNIKIYYLVLVGYDKNLDLLIKKGLVDGLNVVVCDILTEKNRVFSDENDIWDKTSGEKERAIQYFERIKKVRGINFFGYKKLDFAVILHDRLPNWSLPILWKETTGWKCLLRRKSTL